MPAVGAFFLARRDLSRAQWQRLADTAAGQMADASAARELLGQHLLTLPTKAQFKQALQRWIFGASPYFRCFYGIDWKRLSQIAVSNQSAEIS